MRIVAGRLGGRRLVAPKDAATRPTADRVREALFSILGPLSGEAVLDLYAGTGALALEALSRGASRAVLVESRRAALESIAENVKALGVGESVTVVSKPVERSRGQIAPLGPFDLVLCDPPYAAVDRGEAEKALSGLVEAGALSPGARVVLEHASQTVPPALPGFGPPDSRRYGDTTLSFYEPGAP